VAAAAAGKDDDAGVEAPLASTRLPILPHNTRPETGDTHRADPVSRRASCSVLAAIPATRSAAAAGDAASGETMPLAGESLAEMTLSMGMDLGSGAYQPACTARPSRLALSRSGSVRRRVELSAGGETHLGELAEVRLFT
jgi:hypothetical protein